MTQDDITVAKKSPIFTVIAAFVLVLSLFTPFLLLTLPIMATVAFAVAAAFRGEAPRPAPFVVGGLAIVFLVATQLGFSGPGSIRPVSNAEIYKDATWEYGSAKDSMRGTTLRWASLYSPTDLNFASPYDGSNVASIQISGSGWITLLVSKGQFVCHSNDSVAVKFDDGPVNRYPCSSPDNGDSSTLYIQSDYRSASGKTNDPTEGILSAKTMVVEAEFYREGLRQITFNVAGLDKSKL